MGKLAGLLNKMNLDSKIDRPPAAILGRQLTVVAWNMGGTIEHQYIIHLPRDKS